MSTQTAARAALSTVVAANIRAESARRGWTQAEMCRRLSMTPVTMSDRYRERTPWTLDELDRVAEVMGLEVGDLLARPKGFEPLTFWLGADHTVTAWTDEGDPRVRLFCDACGSQWLRPFDFNKFEWFIRQHKTGHVLAGGAFWERAGVEPARLGGRSA